MKKSKLIILTTTILMLCSCSSGANTNNNTQGIINCYSIKAKTDSSTILEKTYSSSLARVYKYQSASGDSIYTSFRSAYNGADIFIYVYKNQYSSNYVKYTYSSFIGWLTCETNYYLDLDNKVIDVETKYIEYIYTNPNNEKANNIMAYNCVKNNYYYTESSGFELDETIGKYYFYLKTDLLEKSLERHSYIKLSSDTVVEYKAKWF